MAANFIRKMEFWMKEHVELRLFKKTKNPKGYLNKGIQKIIFKTKNGEMREVKGGAMWPLRFACRMWPCKENSLLSLFENPSQLSEFVASQQSLTHPVQFITKNSSL